MDSNSGFPTYSRLLKWENCLNTRELGGYPLLDGGQTRWGALVRSDNVAQLTLSGQRALIDYGIRTVIDLRFPVELERQPNPFSRRSARNAASWPKVVNLSLENDQDLDPHRLSDPVDAMRDLYIRLLETNRNHVATVLTAIARAPKGGVLFHCHAGKDRTGLIAAMVLAAVGVPEKVIIEDYALTQSLLESVHATSLENVIPDPDEHLYLSVLWSALPETMRQTLNYLGENYGSPAGYLATTPLFPSDLLRLQARLVEGS
jgi:protein-tyrosine phosphatase